MWCCELWCCPPMGLSSSCSLLREVSDYSTAKNASLCSPASVVEIWKKKILTTNCILKTLLIVGLTMKHSEHWADKNMSLCGMFRGFSFYYNSPFFVILDEASEYFPITTQASLVKQVMSFTVMSTHAYIMYIKWSYHHEEQRKDLDFHNSQK